MPQSPRAGGQQALVHLQVEGMRPEPALPRETQPFGDDVGQLLVAAEAIQHLAEVCVARATASYAPPR